MPVPVSTQRCATAASTGRVTSSQVACTPVVAIDSASSPRTVSASSASAARPRPRARHPAPGRRSAVPPVRARSGALSSATLVAVHRVRQRPGRPWCGSLLPARRSGGGRRRSCGVGWGGRAVSAWAAASAGVAPQDQGAVHEIEAGQVVGGVAAVPAGSVVGGPDAVAAVPGAQGGGGDADPLCGRGHVESESVGLLGDGVGDRDGWGAGRPGHRLGLGGRGRGLHASSCGAWTGRATRPSRGGSASHM